jgi:hypothetical protein
MKELDPQDFMDYVISGRGRKDAVQVELSGNTYRVYPSAIDYARKEARKAALRYGSRDPQDQAFITATLVAAGISCAADVGQERVGARNVKTAWNSALKPGVGSFIGDNARPAMGLCPGNSPPHLCAFRAIIAKRIELVQRDDLLGQMLASKFGKANTGHPQIRPQIRRGPMQHTHKSHPQANMGHPPIRHGPIRHTHKSHSQTSSPSGDRYTPHSGPICFHLGSLVARLPATYSMACGAVSRRC